MTRLSLPGLQTISTTPLRGAGESTWIPGDLKAAPQNPDLVAATLIAPDWHPESLGGVVLIDNGSPLPDALPGWTGGGKRSPRITTPWRGATPTNC